MNPSVRRSLGGGVVSSPNAREEMMVGAATASAAVALTNSRRLTDLLVRIFGTSFEFGLPRFRHSFIHRWGCIDNRLNQNSHCETESIALRAARQMLSASSSMR